MSKPAKATRKPCCVKTMLAVFEALHEQRIALTNDDIAEVGRALLPFLRTDLTAVELGKCSYNATMALRRNQNARTKRNLMEAIYGREVEH